MSNQPQAQAELAGLNKIENGDLVGTFSVEWDGETATATYQVQDDIIKKLQELDVK